MKVKAVRLTTHNLVRKAMESLGLVPIVGADVKNQLAGGEKGAVKPGFPFLLFPPFSRKCQPQPYDWPEVFEGVKPAPFQQEFFDPLFHAMVANVFILQCVVLLFGNLPEDFGG